MTIARRLIPGRGRAGQFRSRVEAHRSAVRWWSCAECDYSGGDKVRVCPECAGPVLYFQSTKERNRYASLRLQQQHGLITDLVVHPTYWLHTTNPGGQVVPVRRFIPDFQYRRGDVFIVEDVKASDAGVAIDPVFGIKRDWFEAEYGIKVHCFT